MALDNEHQLQMEREEHDHNIYAKRVNIVGANGNRVNVTADNKLEVNASVTATVDKTGLATDTNQTSQIRLVKNALDMFGQQVMGQRYNQFEIPFNGTDPDLITTISITKTNGGDAATSNGQAVFSTSTNANGEIKVITNTSIDYQPHFEVYAAFTAIFTAGVANSFQRIGIYDDNNGFFIGYENTSFGITKRTGGTDTTTAKANFNIDTLTGDASSYFTRNGTPEAIDLTKDNLYRIRYGWLGAAPILFEVFSPDGQWVPFHIIRHPNSATVPTLTSTALPMRLHIKKTSADATNLIINTACWAAGATTDLQKLTFAINDNSLVKPVRSILAAKKPNGSYTNIDATAGGNLKVSIEEIDAGADLATQTTLSAINSKLVSGTDIGDVTINNAAGASAVNIQDGGNTITVDGTVSANQSGIWNIETVTALTGITNVVHIDDNSSSITVDGTITANAGTNLNTSALALESGGNLATLAGKDFATQTTLSAINTKLVSGTDIGDVTINNTSGAGAVNIQDGGNSITIDGTVAATQSGTWDVNTLSTITNVVHVDDNSSSLTVDGTVTANQGGTWNINNVSGTVSLPTGASTSANQSTANGYLQAIAGLVPSVFDYISLSYTGTNLTGVVYKSGGSGGTTVSTLTLAYDVSNNLTSVTKS